MLEAAVDTLPETYRTVFMLRDIEGLSTSETGEGLGLGAEAVKTRLHRARAMIRRAVTAQIGEVAPGTFQFHAPTVRPGRRGGAGGNLFSVGEGLQTLPALGRPEGRPLPRLPGRPSPTLTLR